jgi:hypothetical protein
VNDLDENYTDDESYFLDRQKEDPAPWCATETESTLY